MLPLHFEEMIENIEKSMVFDKLDVKNIYLFGHCEATLALIDELKKRGLQPMAILDNSKEKYNLVYKGVPVQAVDCILQDNSVKSIVLIVTRFYESMKKQLQSLGFKGEIRRLVDFNTFAEYSFSEATLEGKKKRCERGIKLLFEMERRYPGFFFMFCPFPALGDVYLSVSFFPYYKKVRKIRDSVVCVSSRACAEVVKLFNENVEVMPEKDLEATIQAIFMLDYDNAFIAHQDRPYPINLHYALYKKIFSLEDIYRVGVFGLDEGTRLIEPSQWQPYPNLNKIPKKKSVILSPYAKSVTALPRTLWVNIIDGFRKKGYTLFTNIVGNEDVLPGTLPISPKISEMKSVVEHAGFFIGIRSGLCDVIRTADCHKTALYPDYHYGDTKWKAIDMYWLDGFENVAVKGGM